MINLSVKTFALIVAISSVVDSFDASKEVYFALYTRKNPTTEQRITASAASISKTNFNAANPTRIYIHGFNSDHTTAMPTALTAAYLKKGTFNVILVDWKAAAGDNYFNAKDYVPLVADQVAKLVKFLVANNYTKLDTLLVSGHSLGAHVAGFTGKKVPGINAIVALDAANLLYSEDKPAERLARTDAKIVQAIHTTNTLGLSYLIGTVDFIMNGGAFQPGCWLDLACSHERAAYFYIESINSNKFVSNGKVMGGEPLATGLKGKYELKTNDNPPYAKG